MKYLRLKKNWPGNFHRTLRDAKGNASKVLEFSPGEIIEVNDDEFPQLSGDVGLALEVMQPPVFESLPQESPSIPQSDNEATDKKKKK